MTRLAIAGWSALCAAGSSPAELAAALRRPAAVSQHAGGPSGQPAGGPPVRAVEDFDVKQHLGRKGTSVMDRWTGLSVVTCGAALSDAGIDLDDVDRDRFGIVLGTTTGGLKSASDYSRETLEESRPYLVNPALFPNTVMNSAPGRAAIWFGLKGVNTTIAGGPVAFLQALRYAATSLERGYVDALLVGAVEELSDQRAWVSHALEPGMPVGEGASVFVVFRAEDPAARQVDAQVLAVATGFGAPGGGEPGRALAGCSRRAMAEAGVDVTDVARVVGPHRAAAQVAADLGLGDVAEVDVNEWLGDCGAAGGALGAATLLALHREDPALDGAVSLLVSTGREGAAAAAVFRGWSRHRTDHG